MARQDRRFENRPNEREEQFGREERNADQWRESRQGGYGQSSGFDQPGYQGGGSQGGYGQQGGFAGSREGYGYGSAHGSGRNPYESGGQGSWRQSSGQPSGSGESLPGYGYGRGFQEREQYGSMGQQGYEGSWGTTGAGYGSGFSQGFQQQRGRHTGRGPKNYRRTDERIQEEINEQLTRHPEIDAYEIEVTVQGAEVILAGFVEDRRTKRLAEDIAEECSGVNEVRNNLRVRGSGPGRGETAGGSTSEVQGQGRSSAEERPQSESRSRGGARR
jgi:osmotically-inducible protein OsmY